MAPALRSATVNLCQAVIREHFQSTCTFLISYISLPLSAFCGYYDEVFFVFNFQVASLVFFPKKSK